MRESVIIIGGGIGGLAVGSYLQMNGFDTEIFEKQDFPGGLCTSWKRKEFFVIGDNIDYSYDSRTFGIIKSDMIIGKMIYKL